MADFEVRAVFTYGDRHWENVWQIDTGSLDDVPSAVIEGLREFHVSTLLADYTLNKIVRRVVGSHDAFVESIYDVPGGRALGSSGPLPLFNTVRLLLQPAAGRPGVKFLRGLLLLTDIAAAGGVLGPTVLELVQTAINTLYGVVVAAECEIVCAADKLTTSGTPEPVAQERQLHRKRKKTV